MEIKEFKVPLYKDEKGNEYISTRHINEGINGKEIGEKDFFDTGNIQGEIKKDNIIIKFFPTPLTILLVQVR